MRTGSGGRRATENGESSPYEPEAVPEDRRRREQYGNKLDDSMKLQQFFDHHLKGADAPPWIAQGVSYHGE
jgi:hypothetical protein